jgi:hypothetical protein
MSDAQAPLPPLPFKEGDYVHFGRFKNKAGKLTRIWSENGVVKIEIEPIPKGRKKSRIRNLFAIRLMKPEDIQKAKGLEVEEARKKKTAQVLSLKVAARFHHAYTSKLWPKAVAAIRKYEVLYQEAMALTEPLTDEGKAVLKRFELDNVDAWPRMRANDFGVWADKCYRGPLSGYTAIGPHGVLAGKASLSAYQASLREEHQTIQAILDSTGPERFTYKGFKIYNRERMSDSLCLSILEAVDYLVALFKKRGVALELLREGLAAIYIAPEVVSMNASTAAGTYMWGVIELSAVALTGSGNLLERFMNEVFLHEFGHHVHEAILPREAKLAWDQPWDAYDDVQEQVKTTYMQTTVKERERWFALLQKTKFDVSKAGARLKGLDKLKFAAWLRQDMWKHPLIKPKRFQLTERGEAVFDLLRRFQEDPEKAALDEFRGISYSPEELKKRSDDIVDTYKGWLGVGPHWRHNVDLDPELVQQLADADPAMGEALAKAKGDLDVLKRTLVTDYAQTNKQEDFAETFVAFMGAPQRLTPETKFRMQRALSLAGLYGKPIMRLGAADDGGLTAVKALARFAAVVDKASVDRWKRDLKTMTKIYKSLEAPSEDSDTASWDEARWLFLRFRNNFEDWAYKELLPKETSDRPRSPLETVIAKLAWDFRYELEPSTLFPEIRPSRAPDWSRFRSDRDRSIKRYQAAANKAFKEIQEYLDMKPDGKVERRDPVEHFEISGVGVVIRNTGRSGEASSEEALQTFLRRLKSHVDQIKKAGFADAVRGLTVTVDFDTKQSEWDTLGRFTVERDELIMYPLGLAGSGSGHGTFTHECGHRFYFKALPLTARNEWEEVMNSRSVEITKEDIEKFFEVVSKQIATAGLTKVLDRKDLTSFVLSKAEDESQAAKFRNMVDTPLVYFGGGGPLEFIETDYKSQLESNHLGEKVQIEEISDYANTNAMEAFAEVFKAWVLKGPRAVAPWTREFFAKICKMGGAKVASDNHKLAALKVAARHQASEVTLADIQNLADEFGVGINVPADGQSFSWDDNDSLADELLDDDTSLTPDMLPAVKVAARYQEKKKVPKANGKGTTEVYVYSEGQVDKRNRDKAERLQKFKPKVEKLRAKVKSDLGSKDRETRLVALAVALIDETHERVGNEESAKGNRNDSGEPHYGVTGWKKKHVSLGSSSATIKYVGKSGVKHEKTVSTPYILSALRQAHKEAEGKDGCLFSGDEVSVTAEKVNEFLEPFGISAKDLRGLAANSLMQKALKKARKGKLPEDKKKREEQLKGEFKEALECVSDELGHEASTLKSQYLAPNMEPEYLKDGTIIDKLDE